MCIRDRVAGGLKSDVDITRSYGLADVADGYDWYGGAVPLVTNVGIIFSYYSSEAAGETRDSDSRRTNQEFKEGEAYGGDIFLLWGTSVWNFGSDTEYPYIEENIQALKPESPENLTATPGNRHLDISWSLSLIHISEPTRPY